MMIVIPEAFPSIRGETLHSWENWRWGPPFNQERCGAPSKEINGFRR
jgi:hypothetical protein